MKVEIFTTAANSEYIVPLFLKHYRACFPEAVINVAVNNSTDSTLKLFEDAGCNILPLHGYIPYKREPILTCYKNTSWKKSQAEWILVCDIDELCHITEKDLDDLGHVDIVRFQGYNMFDDDNCQDPALMVWGAPSTAYSKSCLFRKSIKDINYKHGAHVCTPLKKYKVQEFKYKLLHYKWANFTFENYCEANPKTKPSELKKIWDFSRTGLIKVL